MAEQVRLRNNQGGHIIFLSQTEWNKYGEAERAEWTVLPSEEEEQEKLIAQAKADSNRYDKAVKKDDALIEQGAATADLPPAPQEGSESPAKGK
jgi:hypothetical protein